MNTYGAYHTQPALGRSRWNLRAGRHVLSRGLSHLGTGQERVAAPAFRYGRAFGQVGLLWLLYELGTHLVAFLHLPLPGSVMGMGLLFVLLASGLLRPPYIQEAVSFLLRHFAFFFIPISVGLMVWGALMVQHGIILLCVLLLSALVALATTGLAVHLLMRWRNIHE